MTYGDPDAYGLVGIHVVPRERGEAIHEALLALYSRGKIKPVVGRRARFEDLPEELERMERRSTMGRTILDWNVV